MKELHGVNYDPSTVSEHINSHVFGGRADKAQLKEAYPKAMMYMDKNGIPPTEENIHKHARDIFNKAVAVPAEQFVGNVANSTAPPETLMDKVKDIIKNDWERIVIFILVVALIFMYFKNKHQE